MNKLTILTLTLYFFAFSTATAGVCEQKADALMSELAQQVGSEYQEAGVAINRVENNSELTLASAKPDAEVYHLKVSVKTYYGDKGLFLSDGLSFYAGYSFASTSCTLKVLIDENKMNDMKSMAAWISEQQK